MLQNTIGPQLNIIPEFSMKVPRYPDTIVIPENIEEIQARNFEASSGTAVIYQIAYSEIFQLKCQIVATGWKPFQSAAPFLDVRSKTIMHMY